MSATVLECQQIKKGGLDQYVAERFSRLNFAAIRKSVLLTKKLIAKWSIVKRTDSYLHLTKQWSYKALNSAQRHNNAYCLAIKN